MTTPRIADFLHGRIDIYALDIQALLDLENAMGDGLHAIIRLKGLQRQPGPGGSKGLQSTLCGQLKRALAVLSDFRRGER